MAVDLIAILQQVDEYAGAAACASVGFLAAPVLAASFSAFSRFSRSMRSLRASKRSRAESAAVLSLSRAQISVFAKR